MQRTLDGQEWTIARWQRARTVSLPDEDVPRRVPLVEEIRAVAALLVLGLVLALLI